MTITALPPAPSTSDPSSFDAKADALLAALPTFITETNATAAAMNLNSTTDTSATSNTVGTGAKTFTVTAGKSFVGGMWLIIADTAAPSTNSMLVQITSYSGTTLVTNCVSYLGSGTKTAWVISQSNGESYAGSATQAFEVGVGYAVSSAVRADQIQAQSFSHFSSGGSSTVYTLTPTPAITAYVDGQTFDMHCHATCGAAPTIAVSGLAAKALVRELTSGVTAAIAANELFIYREYKISYSSALDQFVVRDSKVRRVITVQRTRDMTAANGSVAYTGVGFKPKKITAYASVAGTAPNSSGGGNTAAQMCLIVGQSASTSGINNAQLIQIQSTTAGAKQDFVLTSEDADGFTGTWTKTNTPAAGTADIIFVCEE